jgi:hypothetical protein
MKRPQYVMIDFADIDKEEFRRFMYSREFATYMIMRRYVWRSAKESKLGLHRYYQDRKLVASLSQKTLAKMIDATEVTVSSHIKNLVEKWGVIKLLATHTELNAQNVYELGYWVGDMEDKTYTELYYLSKLEADDPTVDPKGVFEGEDNKENFIIPPGDNKESFTIPPKKILSSPPRNLGDINIEQIENKTTTAGSGGSADNGSDRNGSGTRKREQGEEGEVDPSLFTFPEEPEFRRHWQYWGFEGSPTGPQLAQIGAYRQNNVEFDLILFAGEVAARRNKGFTYAYGSAGGMTPARGVLGRLWRKSKSGAAGKVKKGGVLAVPPSLL